MKCKVCFFCGDITRKGGVEKVVCDLANALDNNGMCISVLSLGYSNMCTFFYLNKNISIDIVSTPPYNHLTKKDMLHNMRNILKYIKKRKIDIFINVDVMLGMYTLPLKPFIKCKMISWEHFGFYSDIGSKHTDIIRKISVKYCDYFITITQKDLNDFRKHYNVKCPIKAIYNPFDVVEATKYDIQSKTIISVGNFYDAKGFDMILPIAKLVFCKHRDWKWIVLGDGERFSEIQSRIIQEGLEKYIILKGRVKNPNVFLKKAALFALTSRQESFGMVLLEAQAMHLPIIAFDVPQGPGEIIDNGSDGFLITPFDIVDYAEKICLLIEDRKIREDFSGRADLRLNRFKSDLVVKRWQEVFKELCME